MGDNMPLIAQVSNVSSLATLDQMKKLFGFVGKIKDIKMYPSLSVIQPEFRVCYIKFAESWSVRVAVHLTNTVFIDRALVVVAIPGDSIPSENSTSFDLLNPTSALPGLLLSNFKDVRNDIAAVDGNLVITSLDSNLDILGLPQYPPLSADNDPNTIEEIRRTVYIENINSQVTASELLDFINNVVGEIKYLRMAGCANMVQSAFVEFTDRASIVKALQCDGITLKGNKLKIKHSTTAILKPAKESDIISEKETEEAMKKLKEAESLIARVVEPEITGSSRSRRRSSSCSRKRSRSSHRSPKRDKRSRSRDHRHSKRHRSSSRRRKSRSRSKVSRSRAKRSRSRSKGRRRSHSRSRLSRSRSKSRRSKRGDRSRSWRSRSRSKVEKRRNRRSISRSRRSFSRRRSHSRSRVSSQKRSNRSRSVSQRRNDRSLSRSRSSRSKRNVRSRSHDSKTSKRSQPESKHSNSNRIRSRSRSKTSDVENKDSVVKNADIDDFTKCSRSRSPIPNEEIVKKNGLEVDEIDAMKSNTDLNLVDDEIQDFVNEAKIMEIDESCKPEVSIEANVNVSEPTLTETNIENMSKSNAVEEEIEEKDEGLDIKVVPITDKDSRSHSKRISRSNSRSRNRRNKSRSRSYSRSKKAKSRSRSRSRSKRNKSRSRSYSRNKKAKSRSRSRSRSKLSNKLDHKSSGKKVSVSRIRRYSRSPRKSRRSISRSRRSSSPDYSHSRKSRSSRHRSRSPRISSMRSSKRSISPISSKYKSSDKYSRPRKRSRSIGSDKRSRSRSPRLSAKTEHDAEANANKKIGVSRERKSSYDSDCKGSDSE